MPGRKEKTMAKVLWFSRHEMTSAQLGALEKKLGSVELTQVNKTVQHASELAEEIAAADVVAIVAPIGLQAEFLRLAGEKPVIVALSERRQIDPDNFEFVFLKWERLEKIEVVKSDFAV